MPLVIHGLHGEGGHMHGVQAMDGSHDGRGQRIDGLRSDVTDLRFTSSGRQLLGSRRR